MSVNVFSMNVLIGDTIFMSPTGNRTVILHGHQSHAKLHRKNNRFPFLDILAGLSLRFQVAG